MKSKLFIGIAIFVIVFLAFKYGYLTCSNISNFQGDPEKIVSPFSACEDLNYVGFRESENSAVVGACLAYEQRCDPPTRYPGTGPSVTAEVDYIYKTKGRSSLYFPDVLKAFTKDPCRDPNVCSFHTDCPSQFLNAFALCVKGVCETGQ